MRVAAIQMTVTSDSTENMNLAYHLLQEALDRGTDLVAFPENFSGITPHRKTDPGETETARKLTVQTLQEWAAEFDVWILGGSIPLQPGKKSNEITHSSLLIGESGEIKARYNKIKLIQSSVLSSTLRSPPGKIAITPKTPWGQVGLSISDDLYFPDHYRKNHQQGARVHFIPSSCGKSLGAAHWDVLTRARAIENASYVIAPNQTGNLYPTGEAYGHTRIVDPRGRVICERLAGSGIVWANLNIAEVE